MIDFSDFNPQRISSWIELVNMTPRFPFVVVLSCICVNFVIRRYFKFSHPWISMMVVIFLSTLPDNYVSILNNRKLAVFEHPLMALVAFAIWAVFNFFPGDLLFKCMSYVWPIFNLIEGFVLGRDLTHGIDLAMNYFPTSSFAVLATGVAVAGLKFVLMALYAHKVGGFKSTVPYFLEISIGACAYYYLTDLGHFSNYLWFDKEEMRLYVIIGVTLFNFLFGFVPNQVWISIIDGLDGIIEKLHIYHGNKVVQTEAKTKTE